MASKKFDLRSWIIILAVIFLCWPEITLASSKCLSTIYIQKSQLKSALYVIKQLNLKYMKEMCFMHSNSLFFLC